MSLLQVGNKSVTSRRYAFDIIQSQGGEVPTNYERMAYIMKQNIKFFTIVISLLLLSFIVLVGCMCVVAADNGEMKPYDLNAQKQNSDSAIDYIYDDSTPIAQNSLQAKFEAMYEISEDGKTITVISEAFLDEYWSDLKDRSLSTEEVYYIIQDSIRIYAQYDTVVLSGFGSFAEDSNHAYTVPYISEDVVIKTQSDSTLYYESDDIEAIYEIILYRLKALSSPKAFFTGEEAMLSVGEDPMSIGTTLPQTTFYIPDYSESVDREYILFVVGYGDKMNSTVVEDRFSELFGFCNNYEATISLTSKNYEQLTKVYPTIEIDNKR